MKTAYVERGQLSRQAASDHWGSTLQAPFLTPPMGGAVLAQMCDKEVSSTVHRHYLFATWG